MFLQVQSLTKYFAHENERIFALKDVSFSLDAGRSLAVCGSSGAGKSTLLNLIGGLDRPSSGRVLIGDADPALLKESDEARFRNGILGFVFQFHHLLGDFSVLENVMMPLLIRKTSRYQARREAENLLARIGLSGKEDHFPKELSGGEQQRAAIARAVIHKPALILADEPTGNLDEHNGRIVFDLLCELNHDLKATLIVVTHHEAFAKRLDEVLILQNGRFQSLVKNV